MWQIFTQNTEGLAIHNTIGRLQNALAPENNYKQFIGEVNYIDYKKEYIPLTICFFRFIQEKSFQYEREVRIISDVAESNITLNDGLKCRHRSINSNNLHSPEIRKLKPGHPASKTTWI
jgi:hypothetical protein